MYQVCLFVYRNLQHIYELSYFCELDFILKWDPLDFNIENNREIKGDNVYNQNIY